MTPTGGNLVGVFCATFRTVTPARPSVPVTASMSSAAKSGRSAAGRRMSMAPAGDFIRREPIVKALLEHLRLGRSALLVGPAGIGKTAILHAVRERLRQQGTGPCPIYCPHAPTPKQLLKSMAEGTSTRPPVRSRRSKRLTRMNRRSKPMGRVYVLQLGGRRPWN